MNKCVSWNTYWNYTQDFLNKLHLKNLNFFLFFLELRRNISENFIFVKICRLSKTYFRKQLQLTWHVTRIDYILSRIRLMITNFPNGCVWKTIEKSTYEFFYVFNMSQCCELDYITKWILMYLRKLLKRKKK